MDSQVIRWRQHKAAQWMTARPFSFNERFSERLRMHRIWNIAVLLGVFAAAPLICTAQTYNANGGNGTFYWYTGSMETHQTFTGGMTTDLAPVVAGMGGVAQAVQDVLHWLNTINITSGTAASNIYASAALSVVTMQGMSSNLAGINATVSAANANAANIAGNIATMSTQFPPMVQGMNTLAAQLSAFRASVTNAITQAGQGTEAANQLQTNIAPRLELISDYLRTNQAANIIINNTNGDTSMLVTNVITANVEVPALTNLDQYLIDVQNGKDPVAAARNQVPTSYAVVRSAAETASGFLGITVPSAPDLGSLTAPANFMKLTVAKPLGGGTWVFDANPMTHAPGLVGGFRTGLMWCFVIAFLYKCGTIAQEAVANMGSATQTHSPNVAILGNNAGLAIGLGYVALFVVASGALTIALSSVVDKALFSQLVSSPFAGFGTDSLILANMFLPLSMILSQGLWLLSARWLVVAESWVFNFVIRSLPA